MARSSVGRRHAVEGLLDPQGLETATDERILALGSALLLSKKRAERLSNGLMRRFGSIAEVLSAPESLLRELPEVDDLALGGLRVVRALMIRAQRGVVSAQPVIKCQDTLVAYLNSAAALEDRETFRVLFLNKKNKLIRDEVLNRGTVDRTPVYPREVVKRALDLAASAVIFCHNHPSGDPTPSLDDITMTNALVQALRTVDIVVHDHIIVAREGHVSLRGLGLL